MRKVVLILLVMCFNHIITVAQSSKYYTNEDNVFINGYDVVRMKVKKEAIKGTKEFTSEYDGITFYFMDKRHIKVFEKSPEKFIPAANGYCAYSVAVENKKNVPSDPMKFKIIKGKIYLFCDDTLDLWDKEQPVMLKKFEANWK